MDLGYQELNLFEDDQYWSALKTINDSERVLYSLYILSKLSKSIIFYGERTQTSDRRFFSFRHLQYHMLISDIEGQTNFGIS